MESPLRAQSFPDPSPRRSVLAREDLPRLIQVLKNRGFEVVAPVRRDGAIVYEPIEDAADLPAGWGDEQAPAHYRLRRRNDQALFGHAAGPQSWKKFLFPPEHRLFSATREGRGFRIAPGEPPPAPLALLGVRACDLRALAVLDKVFLSRDSADPVYRERRERMFVVAVHCNEPAATCFCDSVGAGPRVGAGFDLALTEIPEGTHRFVVEAGTPAGEEVLAELDPREAEPADGEAEARLARKALASFQRRLDGDGLAARLRRSAEDPHWEEVGRRCLGCANCTQVCPTCFCATVVDASDLTGAAAERRRHWDSCFSLAFSYIHGGSIRTSAAARYRQWMTHKLSGIAEQFGEPGCVGCGRCIAWCPAGIDITEEARAFPPGPRGEDKS